MEGVRPEATLERFIARYAERGYQFAHELCGNAEDARELVQEAFVRVLRSWDRYDRGQPLERWFLTILRNLYYDGLRRYERRHALSLDGPRGPDADGGCLAEVVADGDEGIVSRLERQETGAAVRRALRRLSPEHRAALTLCDMQGLKYNEIAAALDWPMGTVRSRVFRAREALRKELLSQPEVRDA